MSTTATDTILERLLALHPKLVDLSLDRMWRILADLGHPERILPPAIHVTGTNGKGSVVAFLRAMLEAAGYRVHVYTSPHLVRFNERIRLAGALIEDDHLQSVLDECETVNAGQPITFFEITTAAAFLAFSRTPADFVLLENGLGGRLDATNVLARPALTAITPVSMDHQQFLGDTLSQIAAEKAGIIKPHVPCIVGPQRTDALDVIVGHADANEAPLCLWGVNWRTHAEADGMALEYHGEVWQLPAPALAGAHQMVNAGHAAVIARMLTDADIGYADVAAGLCSVEWPARLQRLTRGPVVDALPEDCEVWLDGGHNPEAGEVTARHVREAWSDKPLYLIAGMIESKDPAGYLGAFTGLATNVSCITIPGEKAAIPAEKLAEMAIVAGLEARSFPSLPDAVRELRDAASGSNVLLCGSLYLAGRILIDHG